MILEVRQFGSLKSSAVVLLHSLALDAGVWKPVISLLESEFLIVAPDLRGHGSSQPNADFTVEDMADDVAETLACIGIGSAAVVGLSLGGCVAQSVAVRYPELVNRLVLADTTAWYGEDAPAIWGGRAERAREEGLGSLAAFQLERWFSDTFRLANVSLCEELLVTFRANDIDSYAATCRALGNYDGRERVGSIGVPTDILVGEHDGATPPLHAYDLAKRISDSNVTVLPDAKHLTALERPDAVADAVRRVSARR